MSDFALALGLAIPAKLPTTHFVQQNGLWVPPGAVKSEYQHMFDALRASMVSAPPRPSTSPMRMRGFMNPWLYLGLDDEPEKPEPLLQETVTECVIGWRCWDEHVVSAKYRFLESTSQDTVWPPGEALKAPTPPTPRNSCGIYAYKTRKDAANHYAETEFYGSVALGGKIIECENGYRAEYAYPQHLYLRYSYFDDEKEADEARRVYASTYGCEVERAPKDEDPDNDED
jgi:hypothetical protein